MRLPRCHVKTSTRSDIINLPRQIAVEKSKKRESNQHVPTHGDPQVTHGGACVSYGNPDVRNDLEESQLNKKNNNNIETDQLAILVVCCLLLADNALFFSLELLKFGLEVDQNYPTS